MTLLNIDDDIYKQLVDEQVKKPIDYPNTRNLVNRILRDWLDKQKEE